MKIEFEEKTREFLAYFAAGFALFAFLTLCVFFAQQTGILNKSQEHEFRMALVERCGAGNAKTPND